MEFVSRPSRTPLNGEIHIGNVGRNEVRRRALVLSNVSVGPDFDQPSRSLDVVINLEVVARVPAGGRHVRECTAGHQLDDFGLEIPRLCGRAAVSRLELQADRLRLVQGCGHRGRDRKIGDHAIPHGGAHVGAFGGEFGTDRIPGQDEVLE